MAIGQASDFVIYQEQFHTGFTEMLMQEANVFNAASANTIILDTNMHKGDFVQEAFYQELTNLVTRRDTTSVAGVTDIALTQAEDVSVKLNRKIGPVANTVDSFRKIAKDPGEMSFILGQQWAKATLVEYINTALVAADIAFAQNLTYDGSAATMTHGTLVQGLSQFGDASGNVAAFVMHSKQYHDLMGASISDKITDVANQTIHQGTTSTLGRPTIVSDIVGLIDTVADPDEYHCLGLVPGAIRIGESENRQIASELVTGLENLVLRYQGEYAYTVKLKGYAWDITNGGANPDTGTLNTATNWDKVVTDNKSTGGVQIVTQ